MSEKTTLNELRERLISQSLKDLWWLARNGVTYRSPMTLQAIELTVKKNPQGDYQVCHVKDDGDDASCWFVLAAMAPARKVESRGNTTIFRAAVPGPSKAPGPSGPFAQKESVSISPVAQPRKQEKNIPEKIDDMCQTIADLEAKVDRLLDANELIKNLEHRERYLREAEEVLHQKMQSMEHDRAELEQLRDELEKRRFRLGTA